MSTKRKGRAVKTGRIEDERKYYYDMDALFEKFLAAKTAEGLAKSTVDNYRRQYGVFVSYLDEHGIGHDIRNVTADLVRDYARWLLDDRVKFDGHKYKPDESKTRGLSPRTVHDYVKCIRMFFRFLASEGIIDEDPLAGLKNVKYTDPDIQVLTPEEIKALLAAPNQRKYADFRDYVLMTLLLDSMLRINEACSLKKSDIDWRAGTIMVRASVAKTRKPRVVPVQKRTLRLLKELINETEEFDSEYVFLANYGEPLTPNQFRQRLNKYAKEAGLKRNVYPHLFRHTAATMALENGMSVRHLQLILGHSDLRMITRYTHLTTKELAKQHEQYSALNRVLEAKNKPRKILR